MMDLNEFFFQLTPDVIMKALVNSAFEPTGHCLALNSYENRVFDCMLEDESHVVVKFYRPGRWTKGQIQEEHDFLFELHGNEIPVCAPVIFSDGSSIHQIEGIYYSLWPRTGGRIPDEFTKEELLSLGRYIARIHNTGASQEAQHRISLTGKTYGTDHLNFLLEGDFLPAACKDKYSTSVREIVTIYETLLEDVPLHRIHGDCHRGNLLKGREGWFFLDFDDFLTGPAVQDIWLIAPGRDREGLLERDLVIEGYLQFREFDYSWLRLVEPLRALRYVRYAAWIAKRWDDPAFPAAFPHFGTEQYWENETADLLDQLEYIHGAIDDLPENLRREEPEEKTEELTNKDYFWDME